MLGWSDGFHDRLGADLINDMFCYGLKHGAEHLLSAAVEEIVAWHADRWELLTFAQLRIQYRKLFANTVQLCLPGTESIQQVLITHTQKKHMSRQ